MIISKRYPQKVFKWIAAAVLLLTPAAAFSAPLTGSGTEADPYKITTIDELDSVRNHLDAHFMLMNDLDFADTKYDSANSAGRAGWMPIGTADTLTRFTGTFHGKGHLIRNLFIDRTIDHVGLFGYMAGATIDSLGVVDCNVRGGASTGGLAGRNGNGGTITNCFATGRVSGGDNTGILAGVNYSSSVIEDCYSMGSASSIGNVGGLVGLNSAAAIRRCFSTGNVANTKENILGTHGVGGLVGFHYNECEIRNSFSTGNAAGNDWTEYVGGFVGNVDGGAAVRYCYSTGRPSGSMLNSIQGFVGRRNTGCVIQNCYYDRETSDTWFGDEGGGVMTTSQMMTQNTYAYWNFTDIWQIKEGETYPWLRSNSGKPVARNASAGTAEETAVEIDVLAHDAGGVVVDSFRITVEPANGSVVNGSRFTYTPAENYVGPDSFKCVAIDSEGLESNEALVKIMVTAQFSGGDGTEDDPYQITELYQLDAMRYEPGKHYVLMNDLDFGGSQYDSTNSVGNAGWKPIGTRADKFTGSFRGKGFKLSNMFIYRPTENYVGLFGYIEGALIDSVVITGSKVRGKEYVGSLVGESCSTSTITNSYVTGYIRGSQIVGGLVGRNAGGSHISSCFSGGVVQAGSYTGGLTGVNSGSTISDCYSHTNVMGSANLVGSLLGDNRDQGTITRSYATGHVTGAQNVGGVVGLARLGATESDCYWDTVTANISASSGGTGKSTAEMKQQVTFDGWDFDLVWEIREGVTYPGLRSVNDAPILKDVRDTIPENASIDIELTAYDVETGSIGNFVIVAGALNGTAAITGTVATYTPASDFAGIDSFTYNTEDPNSYPATVIIYVAPAFSGGDGEQSSPYHITNLDELDKIRTVPDRHYVLMNDLDFTGSPYDSVNSVDNKGWDPIDGFSGSLQGNGHTIENLFIGRADEDSVGLFGYIRGAEIDSLVLSNCTVKGWHGVGALIGVANDASSIANVKVTGIVSGKNEIGGLVGMLNASSTLSKSRFEGNVSGTYQNVGGLAGECSGSTISRCYSTGVVTVTGVAVGGLVGNCENGSISDCYSISSVSGTIFCGGLAGQVINSTITLCYSAGPVINTDTNYGELIGYKDTGSSINVSYYDMETTNEIFNGDVIGIPLTTSAMMSQGSFDGWDFNTIWGIDEGNGYPYLRNVTKVDFPTVNRIVKPQLSFKRTAVTIFTLSGRVVGKETFQKAFTLDGVMSRARLSRGTYLVRVDVEGVGRTVRRVIKR